MTYTRAIGLGANKIIRLIVRGLALSKINPNVLTFIGSGHQHGCGCIPGCRQLSYSRIIIIFAGLFDMVDGRVARETNQVTRFGAFFDSVLDRYSDLGLLVGLLVYYGTINRPSYVVLTAMVMTASVMISYARTRAENIIPTCKVGFLERPGTGGAAYYRRSIRPHGAGALGYRRSGKSNRYPPHDLHIPGSEAA